MKKIIFAIIVLVLFSSSVFCNVFSYSFPKAPKDWGKAVSFNNLSPGFFQVLYNDNKGTLRIATYGIAGGSMDELKDPQLMMVFVFDQEEKIAGVNLNE